MIEQSQTEKIKAFVKKSGIRYYDLELEIADHISEWIIADMQMNNSNFELSFSSLPQTFPAEEMKIIQESKSKYLKAKYQMIFRQEFKLFFVGQKILVLVLLLALVATMDIYLSNRYLLFILPTTILLSLYVTSFANIFNSHLRIKFDTSAKKYLLAMNAYEKWHSSVILPLLLYLQFIQLSQFTQSLSPDWLYTIIFYSWPLQFIFWLSVWRTRIIVKQNLIKNYPEAFQTA